SGALRLASALGSGVDVPCAIRRAVDKSRPGFAPAAERRTGALIDPGAHAKRSSQVTDRG
ncbi:MAG: hypothetical protein ACYDEO_05240, partial [Aggregatilineales bacterium]